MESFESAKRKKVIWENKKRKQREHEELLEKEGFEPISEEKQKENLRRASRTIS